MIDIEYLKELFITGTRFRPNAKTWCLKNHPDLYNEIMKELPEFDDFQDKIWCLINGVRHCELCGAPIGWGRRAKVYCSQDCAKKARKTIIAEKMKKTSIERYGFENPASAPEIQAKFRKTNLEKYGSISPFGSKEVHEKSKQTIKERYGVECVAHIPMSQEKRKERSIERYGVEHPAQCEEIKEKMRKTCLERYGANNYFGSQEFRDRMNKMKQEYAASLGVDNATLVGPTKYGMVSKEFLEAQQNNTMTVELLKENYSDYRYAAHRLGFKIGNKHITAPHRIITDWLDESGIEYFNNDRVAIKPKELDIWIPSFNLAIEINGIYWHRDKKHYNKFVLCQEQGIKLLQFSDYDILHRQNIVKSIVIDNLWLNEHLELDYYQIAEIDKKTAQEFLRDNDYIAPHDAYYLGIIYDDILVSLCCFTVERNVVAIYRYCNMLFLNIDVFKIFEDELCDRYAPKEIITYSVNLIEDGLVFRENGYMPEYSDECEKYDFIYQGKTWEYYGAGITKWVKKR